MTDNKFIGSESIQLFRDLFFQGPVSVKSLKRLQTGELHIKFHLGGFAARTFYLELIYLPSNSRLFLSCRPFVVITTLSTSLVGVEVTSVSWLGQLTVGV